MLNFWIFHCRKIISKLWQMWTIFSVNQFGHLKIFFWLSIILRTPTIWRTNGNVVESTMMWRWIRPKLQPLRELRWNIEFRGWLLLDQNKWNSKENIENSKLEFLLKLQTSSSNWMLAVWTWEIQSVSKISVKIFTSSFSS